MPSSRVKPEDAPKTKEILLKIEEYRILVKKITTEALAKPTSEDIVKDKINSTIRSCEKFLSGYGTNYKELTKSALNGLRKLANECIKQVSLFFKTTQDNLLAKSLATTFAKEKKDEPKVKASPKTFVVDAESLDLTEDLLVKFKETSGEYGYDQMVIDDYQKRVKEAISKISKLTLTEKTFKEVNGRKVGAPVFVSIRNKAEMAVRYDAMKEELKELVDSNEKYVIVSQHADASLRCSPLQGLLYKLDVDPNENIKCVLTSKEMGSKKPKQIGTIDGNPYYSLKEAMSYGLFSYNCRHRFIKYIPGQKITPQYKYDSKAAEEKREIDLQMRQMERQIRMYKEREALSLDSKERKAYIKLSKEAQAKYKAYATKHGRDVNLWRCSITTGERTVRKINGSTRDAMEQEMANPNSNENTAINLKIISSAEYDLKFKTDDMRTSDCKKIAAHSREILNKRNKSEYEDVFAYNIDTGKIINGDVPNQPQTANRSRAMEELAVSNSNYIVVHNHPKSGMPSAGDLTGLLKTWKNSKCCYVICHNGDVWRYKIDYNAVQKFDNISTLDYNRDSNMEDVRNAIINKTDPELEAAKRISKKYGLIIERA